MQNGRKADYGADMNEVVEPEKIGDVDESEEYTKEITENITDEITENYIPKTDENVVPKTYNWMSSVPNVSLMSTPDMTFDQFVADWNAVQFKDGEYGYFTNEFTTPYRSYVEEKNTDYVYRGLLNAWRIATFELSDVAKYSKKEVGFYEKVLFSVLYKDVEMENISGEMKKAVNSIQASTLKKTSKLVGSSISEHIKIKDMSTEEVEQLTDAINSCDDLQQVFKGVGDVVELLDYVSTVEELVYKLATIEAVSRHFEEEEEILKHMRTLTNNVALQYAIDDIILACSKNTPKEIVTMVMTEEAVVEKASEKLLDEIAKLIFENLGSYGYAIQIGQKGGKALSSLLFSTDKQIENFSNMCAFYEFETIMKSTHKYYESRYLSSKSDINARMLNATYRMFLRTHMYGIDISQEYADITYKDGVFQSLLYGLHADSYEAYTSSLKHIKSTIDETLSFMDNILYNTYLEEYYPEEAGILSLEPEALPYTQEEENKKMNFLVEESQKVQNIVIDENYKLSEDLTTYGSLILEGGTLDLNGHTLNIGSHVYQKGGVMNINGGRLNVGGNYYMTGSVTVNNNGEKTYTSSSGGLLMTNKNDYVCVGGDFVKYSGGWLANRSSLTNGTLELKGDLTQIGVTSSSSDTTFEFNSTGEHKIIFSGTEQQKISSDMNINFANLDIKNETGPICFNSNAYVSVTLTQPGGADIQGRENVTLQNKPAFEDHGTENSAINKHVGNAENVIPTWKDYEAYINGVSPEPTSTPTPTAEPTATPTLQPTSEPTVTAEPVEPTETPATTTEPTMLPQIDSNYVINNITESNGALNVNITKETGSDAQLIVAAYSDETLVNVVMNDILLADGSTDNVSVNLNTEGATYVVAFIWDSLANMLPVSDKFSIDL